MTSEERLPPNYQKLDTALRSIGYSFESAVADIVDNSIDAGSRTILVRLIKQRDGQLDLAVWDDGCGMNEAILKEAMRFGADVSREIHRLGKFGLGLKLAALSQARELRVVSARDGKLAGRAWLDQAIASGFTSTILDAGDCRRLLAAVVPDRVFRKSGTLVCLSRLYKVGYDNGNPDEHTQKLMRRLQSHLALAFHRFLSGRTRRVGVTIDIFDQVGGKAGIPYAVDPLDPFGYPQSGRKGFPAKLVVEAPYGDSIAITAHIWPPNSSAPEYKLPGGANSRQGFYFYRNNRLIQGGGWNGIREVEPHASLARLEVDVGPNFDVEVSLDVKKVEIQLPAGLATAIKRSKTNTGIDFKKYLSLATETYRTRKATHSELPLIPSVGLPAPLSEYLHDELRLKSTAKHRDLKITWKQLDKKRFFEIDRDEGRLYLNRTYRKRLLHGLSGSSSDIPVVKCLLFLVLEGALSSERMGSKIKEGIERLNRILVRAVKFERSYE